MWIDTCFEARFATRTGQSSRKMAQSLPFLEMNLTITWTTPSLSRRAGIDIRRSSWVFDVFCKLGVGTSWDFVLASLLKLGDRMRIFQSQQPAVTHRNFCLAKTTQARHGYGMIWRDLQTNGPSVQSSYSW